MSLQLIVGVLAIVSGLMCIALVLALRRAESVIADKDRLIAALKATHADQQQALRQIARAS